MERGASDATNTTTANTPPSTITARDEPADQPVEPVKKKRRLEKSIEDKDAKLAAKLQAQENSLARRRTTRGASSNSRTNSTTKKSTTKRKQKSDKRVRAEDDSDIPTDGESAPAKRKPSGGFQKPVNLSPALAEVCGASQVSPFYYLFFSLFSPTLAIYVHIMAFIFHTD